MRIFILAVVLLLSNSIWAASKASSASVKAASGEAALSQQEIDLSRQVHDGHIQCELGASFRLSKDAVKLGYVTLEGGGRKFSLRPVVTTTGALRLEDKKAGAVWIQLSNKSMLLDQKNGRRLADDCMSRQQQYVAQAMKTNPPRSLLD